MTWTLDALLRSICSANHSVWPAQRSTVDVGNKACAYLCFLSSQHTLESIFKTISHLENCLGVFIKLLFSICSSAMTSPVVFQGAL